MSEAARCRSCGAAMTFITTAGGKPHPVDAEPQKRWVRYGSPERPQWKLVDTYSSHFATCPNAEQHRRPRDAQSND